MNNFDFNGKHYLQVGGTAMGTKVAPSFANIFMANFEDKFVYSYHTQPLIWLRYIDDIFMVWNHDKTSLELFLEHLNRCHKTIKFTSDISADSVNFLDTSVKIDDNRHVYTDLYCKPTDSHNYLLYESSHPSHLKRSLPYSQFLRIRRICTKLHDYDSNAILIAKHFIRRHYPVEIVEEALIKARRADRQSLLNPTRPDQPKDKEKQFFLITHYNPEEAPLEDIVKQTWPILGRSIHTENAYAKRVIFGHSRTKNLKDILVHAKLPKVKPDSRLLRIRSAARRCVAKSLCRYCPKLNKSGNITSTSTGNTYSTKYNITCNSNNLIYCISCKVCHKQYVGQTKNAVKDRFKGHFYSIENPVKSDTSVGRHFSSNDHHGIKDVIIHILEFIQSPNETPSAARLRDDRELFWIHRLSTLAPLGLNAAD
jgi:hypothetical protein